jgi:putative ABC transport system permease protein
MGNFRIALFLAYKSIIKGSRWTLVLIILVMSLSFANLILTPSIMSGVTEAINKEQINTLFGNIIIDPLSNQYFLNDVPAIENKLKQIPGISGIAPHLINNAYFEYAWEQKTSPEDKGNTGNWNVIGIDPDKETQVTTINKSIIEGGYLSAGDIDQIVLGVEIAGGEKADSKPFLTLGGVKAGDKVRLTFPNMEPKEFTVKGIFLARGGGANNLAFISNQDMAAFMGPGVNINQATQILVKTQEGINADQVLAQVSSLGIAGQVRSWLDYGGGIGGIVSSFGVIASLIGGIGLLVAGVVMFIVIYINVANRKRQIGILRAIGIHRDVVLLSYLIQALLYAVVGIIIGGLIFGYIIKPYFDAHPIDLPIGLVSVAIDPNNIRNAIIGLIVSAILAGVIPVLNITRHSIIKAIWGD